VGSFIGSTAKFAAKGVSQRLKQNHGHEKQAETQDSRDKSFTVPCHLTMFMITERL